MLRAFFNLKVLLSAGVVVAAVAALAVSFFEQDRWQAESLKSVAEIKWSEEDYLGAVRDYEKIIERYPKSPWVAEAHYWKAVALSFYLQDLPGAVVAFEAALQEVGGQKVLALKVHNALAELYQKKLKDPPKAIAALEAIAEISDSSEKRLEVRYQIGALYYEMGEMIQARLEWDLLIDLAGPEYQAGSVSGGEAKQKNWIAEALYRKAGSYFVSGQCELALVSYQALYRRFPLAQMAVFAKFRAANCLEMTDKAHEALQLYHEIRKTYSDPQLIEQKIATLEGLGS